MASKLAADPRIDPRLKGVFGAMNFTASGDVTSREQLLAEENSEAGNAMAASIPGARYAEMDGTGHLAHLERPSEFNRLVMDFLPRLRLD